MSKIILEPLKDDDKVVVHLTNHSAVYDPNQKDPVKRVYLRPGEDYQALVATGTRRYDIRLRIMPPESAPDPTLMSKMRSYLAEHFGIEMTDAQALALARISNGLEPEPIPAQSRSQGN